MEQQIFPVYGIIYRLRNKINGKIYIGQTIKSMQLRINRHLRADNPKYRNMKFKSHIQCAIRKYGRANFEATHLCECYSREDLNWAEKFYIQEYYDSWNNSKGYNISGGGEYGDTLSHHPKLREISKKMSDAKKDKPNLSRKGMSLKFLWIRAHGEEKTEELFKELSAKHKAHTGGENNGMYGKTAYSVWLEKFGKDIADEKYKELCKKNSENAKRASPETNAKKGKSRLGKSTYSIWLKKYGKDEADRRLELCVQRRKDTLSKKSLLRKSQ